MREENAIQAAIVRYCDVVLDEGWRCIAVPNASIRTAGGRAGNFCPGLAKGFPDLLLLGPNGSYCAMEVKTAKGRLSEPQKEWAVWFTNVKTRRAVVRSVDDVKTALTVWNIPTRQHRIM